MNLQKYKENTTSIMRRQTTKFMQLVHFVVDVSRAFCLSASDVHAVAECASVT